MTQSERIKFELGVVYDNIIDSAIYMHYDTKLTLESTDDSFFKMLGYNEKEFSEILDYSFLRCVYAPDRELLRNTLRKDEIVSEINVRLMDKDAKVIWYMMKIVRTEMKSDNNQVFFCVFNDITAIKNTEIEYTTQSRFMDLIQTSIEGGTKICFDDRRMSMAYVGKDLLNFLGYTHDEFMDASGGCFLNIIYEQDQEEARDIIDSWFKSGNDYEVEYRIKRKDGTLIWVLDKGNRIKNENGDNVLVSLIMDINNTRQIIDKLEEANNDLKCVQNSIPGSFGKIAIEEEGLKIISANSRLFDMLGAYDDEIKKKKRIVYKTFGLNQALINEIAIRREQTVEIEHEAKDSHNWFIIRATYANELLDNRYPIYYVMITDITAQKESQFQSEVQKEKYEKIIEITDDIVFEYDCVADVMVFSEKYIETFNRPQIVFDFRNVLAGFDEGEPGYINFSEVFNAIFAGKQIYRCEKNVMINNDCDIWFELTAKGICNDNGDVVKVIGILRDIDKQKREQQKLYDRSRIDLLSQLLNKISTQDEIISKINMMQQGMYVGLIMIDIDDFKSINDIYGHSTGDEVIKKIATLLKKKFREYDVIGRVGGDEFQVLMTEILDPSIIEEKSEMICNEVKQEFAGTILEGKVTVSIGVYYTGNRISYDVLYKKADVALYKAKSGGKNRYEVYGKDNDNASVQIEKTDYENSDDNEVVSSQVFAMIARILGKSNASDSEIEKAFSIIGNEINVDRIVVNIFDTYTETYSVFHEWYRNDLYSLVSILQNRPLSEYVIFNDNGKIAQAYYADDEQTFAPSQRLFFRRSGASGIVQIPINVEGRTNGYIEFVTLDEKRIFTNHELKTLTNISVLIKNYILATMQTKKTLSCVAKIFDVVLQNCESCIEVNLNDYSYKKFVVEADSLAIVERGEDFFSRKYKGELSYVLPKYKPMIMEKMSKEVLENLSGSEDAPISVEYETEKFGRKKWMRKFAVVVNPGFGVSRFLNIVTYDITDEKEQLEKIRNDKLLEIKRQIAAEYLYEEIFEILLDDMSIDIIYVKENSRLILAHDSGTYDESIAYAINEFVHPDDKQVTLEALKMDRLKRHFAKSDTPINCFHRRKGKNGKYVWVCVSVINVSMQTGYDSYLLLVRMDIDYMRQVRINNKLISQNEELHMSEEILKVKAKFDKLTGVYNIDEFYNASTQLINNEEEYKLAVVRMDIDKFKLINDLYGYDTGDDILKFAADTIRKFVHGKGVYGRINSDIFCICLKYNEKGEIIDLIERIISRLNSFDEKCRITPFFGVCLIEDKSIDISVLCDWANLALKKIKGSRLVSYSFYDNNMRKTLLDERKFESEMEDALESGQFEAYLQPQYDIRTSRVISAEALVRWNHPQEGTISPGRFIPLFERNGFIIKVDEFMWREACKILRRWIDDGYKPVPISVNVSRLHMFDDNLADKLVALLNEYKLPRHLIVLEVTETVYYDDSESMNRTLNKMRNMGFQIAMDDFGSGYSSLNMLENMNVDELKIDRAFLSRAGSTENGKVIVQFIITLAKRLNLRVVAEGVENVEQAAMLLEIGCNIAQGYYYSRPVPINKFETQAFDVSMRKEVPPEVQRVIDKLGLNK